jgi:ribosomal protein S18 acetylase RimI-like enzyme
MPTAELAIRPLTPARWAHFESIFNARGCSVARGCWCMYYRRSGEQPAPPPGKTRAEINRRDFKALVDAGTFTGLIAYNGRTPVGWLSLGPRDDFAKLRRSPVMKAVDDKQVWSIICFVVPAEYRGQGVARALLEGAIAFAKRRRVTLLEAYPVDKRGRSNDENMWFGAKSMFDACGFEEVARRKPARPIVRIRPA